MRIVIDTYTIVIAVVLVLALLIAWRLLGRARRGSVTAERREEERVAAPTAAVEQERPVRRTPDGAEGNGIADQGAAATGDVYGEVLGVDVHRQLPGAEGPPDNLEMMKGVGPKFVTRLNESGIIRFEQLARLSDNEVAMLDERMGPFRGRLRRDRVVEQAAFLARGDRDGFEAVFGKLGSGT